MKRTLTYVTLVAAILLLIGTAPAHAEGEGPGADEEPSLLNRIDFGNAYVMGQTIQSGAVYLLNRKKTDIRSMLRERKDFRAEIHEDAEVVDPTLE